MGCHFHAYLLQESVSIDTVCTVYVYRMECYCTESSAKTKKETANYLDSSVNKKTFIGCKTKLYSKLMVYQRENLDSPMLNGGPASSNNILTNFPNFLAENQKHLKT